MDLESGTMPLDQRLEDLGLDPQEYKTYVNPHMSGDNKTGTVLTNITGCMPANKKSTSASKNGSPRRAKKHSGNGRNSKIHRTT